MQRLWVALGRPDRPYGLKVRRPAKEERTKNEEEEEQGREIKVKVKVVDVFVRLCVVQSVVTP